MTTREQHTKPWARATSPILLLHFGRRAASRRSSMSRTVVRGPATSLPHHHLTAQWDVPYRTRALLRAASRGVGASRRALLLQSCSKIDYFPMYPNWVAASIAISTNAYGKCFRTAGTSISGASAGGAATAMLIGSESSESRPTATAYLSARACSVRITHPLPTRPQDARQCAGDAIPTRRIPTTTTPPTALRRRDTPQRRKCGSHAPHEPRRRRRGSGATTTRKNGGADSSRGRARQRARHTHRSAW